MSNALWKSLSPQPRSMPIARRNRTLRQAVDFLEMRVLMSNNPSVASVSPSAGATGVALNMPVTVSVNLPNGRLTANTVINNNVTLYPTRFVGINADQVPATVNTTGGGDAIILTPSVNLQPNTSYTFGITSAVQDVNGDSFTPFTETFTTGNTPPSVNQTVAFSKTQLSATNGNEITCMQMGPDGMMYASTVDGEILRYAINGDGTFAAPQVITSLQSYEGGNRLISGFCFDPAATASNPILWVSNTYDIPGGNSGASSGVNFTGKLTVMSGFNLQNVQDAIINLPRSVADHVNDVPTFGPGGYLYFCQAGQNAYGAPDSTWVRPETMLSGAILRVNTSALNLSGPPLNVLTPDARDDSGNLLGGTYNPFAANAPLTIYADGIRNAYNLFYQTSGAGAGTLWAPSNGSSAGGNTPAYNSGNPSQINGTRIDTGAPYSGPNVPALSSVQQTEADVLNKIVQGAYYGHPNPTRGEYVLDDGNPTSGGVPGLVFNAYPAGTNPDANYHLPDFIFGLHNSPDDMIQYTGSAFGGALNGKFLVTEESAGSDVVVLTPDGNDHIVSADRTVSGFTGFANPLAIVENPATGYLYVSELGTGHVTLLKPSTVGGAISPSASFLAFNGIAPGSTGAGPSRAESITITNTGSNPDNIASCTVINDPNASSANAADYTITNLGSLPTTLAAGASTTITLTYTASAAGLQPAILQINGSDATTSATLAVNVELNGIGTPGQFGYAEPSLVQVLRANGIPTIVGDGPNDTAPNNFNIGSIYPETPDPSSQEVSMQRLQVANSSQPVTIQMLASFNAAASPTVRFGYYASGNPSTTNELFTINNTDVQTVYPTPQGATSFSPGASPFSLYAVFPGISTSNGKPDIHYSEDVFNTLDPSHPRKFRFFPLKNPDGSVVANAYIVAAEDFNSPQYNSFVNFVGIIRNVMPAANAVGAPVIGIQNLDGSPSSTRLVFNRIQIPNATVADIVHDTVNMQINNTGTQPLVLSSLVLSDTTNWQITAGTLAGGIIPTAGSTIQPGQSITFGVKFIATSNPPHTDNQTNDTAPAISGVSAVQAGGVWNGTLTINSNDPINSSQPVSLEGYWQYETEHETEPSLQTVVNKLFGYQTQISATQTPNLKNSGTTAKYYGEELRYNGLWNVADPTQSVTIQEIDSWQNQYDLSQSPPVATTPFASWYLSGAAHGTLLFTNHVNQNQSLFPGIASSSSTPAIASFSPSGAFGLNLNGEKSQDSQNTMDMSIGNSGHAVRAWPLRDANGNIVPNAYIIGLDYQNSAAHPANSDFQDMVFIMRNVAPNAMLGTPKGLQISLGVNGVNVQWEPVNGATGYNIYRSVNNGAATKITSSPVTGISYVDTGAAAGANVSYQVYAISASAQGIPATGSISLSTPAPTPPSTPPTAPVSLSGDGSSGTQIFLSWTGSAGATSYTVQRQGPSDSTFVTIATGVTVTTLTDTAVIPGDTYTYRVEALNSFGSSAFTTSAPVTVFSTPAPTAPTNVTGDGSSGSQVSLTWSLVSGATSYDVLRQGPTDSTFIQVAGGLTSGVYIDTAVTQGQTYLYEVEAQNAGGTSAPSSPAVAVTVTTPSMPPAVPNNFSGTSNATQVILTWDPASGAASYIINRQGPNDTGFVQIASGVSAATYTDNNVTAGAQYSYEIQSVNAVGMSSFTPPITVTVTLPAPATPTGALATVNANGAQIVFSWIPVTGATSYSVDRQGPGDSSFVTVATALTSASYADTAVTPGSTYQYEVQAVGAGGSSSFTSPVSATVPVPPQLLDVTVGKGANKKLIYTADDGTLTTILLNGRGTATVHFTSVNVTDSTSKGIVTVTGTNVTIAGISTAGTVGGSILMIKTKNGSNSVSIGAISADAPLGAIIAPTATLQGAISISGSLGKVMVASVNNANIVADSVGNFVIHNNAVFTLNAGTLHALKVGGILQNSTITLTSGGTLDLANLSAVQIANTAINTTGNIGTITALSLLNSQIGAGVSTPLPSVSSDFTQQASIANIMLKRHNGASDTNSTIAAAVINKLQLAQVQFDNGGAPFGVAAHTLNTVSLVVPASGKVATFHRVNSQATATADLASDNIAPQDFVLRIV